MTAYLDIEGFRVAYEISDRKERDRFGNDVSIISIDKRIFRMVHHTDPTRLKQRATIYARAGMFLRYESFFSFDGKYRSYIKIDENRLMIDNGSFTTTGETTFAVTGKDLPADKEYLVKLLFILKDSPLQWQMKIKAA